MIDVLKKEMESIQERIDRLIPKIRIHLCTFRHCHEHPCRELERQRDASQQLDALILIREKIAEAIKAKEPCKEESAEELKARQEKVKQELKEDVRNILHFCCNMPGFKIHPCEYCDINECYEYSRKILLEASAAIEKKIEGLGKKKEPCIAIERIETYSNRMRIDAIIKVENIDFFSVTGNDLIKALEEAIDKVLNLKK